MSRYACPHGSMFYNSCRHCQASVCPQCGHTCKKHSPIMTKPYFEDTALPIKHSGDFKIIVVLDESGSMESIRKDMIHALNDLIQ
jgi:C4-type Zn-finger protein